MPGDIAGWLPNPWLFIGIWVVGGLYALLGVECALRVSARCCRAAAANTSSRGTRSETTRAFSLGGSTDFGTGASIGAISLVFGESVASLLSLPKSSAYAIAMSLVVVFTLMLVRGTRLGDLAQRITTLAKAVALLVLAGERASRFAGRAHVTPAAHPVATTTSLFAALMLAAQGAIYTYDGWSGPIYFSEELDDPARQIPRSMFYGLLCVAVIYLLINIAFVYTVPTSALAGSPLAAATVASALFGGRGDILVRLVVIASMPSAVNACLLSWRRARCSR